MAFLQQHQPNPASVDQPHMYVAQQHQPHPDPAGEQPHPYATYEQQLYESTRAKDAPIAGTDTHVRKLDETTTSDKLVTATAETAVAAVKAKNAIMSGVHTAQVKIENLIEPHLPIDKGSIEDVERKKHHLDTLSAKAEDHREHIEQMARPAPTVGEKIEHGASSAGHAISGAFSSMVHGMQNLFHPHKQHLPLDAHVIEEAERKKHHLDILTPDEEKHRREVEALRDPTIEQRLQEVGHSLEKGVAYSAAKLCELADHTKAAVKAGIQSVNVSTDTTHQAVNPDSIAEVERRKHHLPTEAELAADLKPSSAPLQAVNPVAIEEVERRKHQLSTQAQEPIIAAAKPSPALFQPHPPTTQLPPSLSATLPPSQQPVGAYTAGTAPPPDTHILQQQHQQELAEAERVRLSSLGLHA